jgi:hypothetical protein
MAEEDVVLLRDAARVHTVSRTVRDALAVLAARPLSEDAAAQMRAALDDTDAARASLDRLRAEADNGHEEMY